MYQVFRRNGKKFGSRLNILRHSNEMVIGKKSDKARIPKPAGGHSMRFSTLMLL